MAKVIYNNIIPFKGNKTMAIWPFIFARKSAGPLAEYEVNHETIHLRQQFWFLVASVVICLSAVLTLGLSPWWMLLAPFMFFLWYGIEYAIRYILYRDAHEAYKNVAFEQEAYMNEHDMTYPERRKAFAWVKYLTRKTYRRQ